MSTQPKPYLTPEEYLALDRAALEVRSEYHNGEIFAMTGATLAHSRIINNISGELRQRLKGSSCEAIGSELRLRTPTGLFTYPDVVVICGQPELLDNWKDTLLSPSILFEVLSPSTEAYNRGEKARHYRTLPSLREYLFVASERIHVEHFIRQDEHHWLLSEHSALTDTVRLDAARCELPLSEIYDNVSF